ncbi:MAG TPA: amidohydrolase family protein [Stellaceae bacterium]|jgi:predicted TIM-barrel fold metal-dependent hydrolase
MADTSQQATQPYVSQARVNHRGIVDCDIHPVTSVPGELTKYMSKRWAQVYATFGARVAQPFIGMVPYPRMTAGNGSRLDAFPPSGGAPGSDLTFMRQQLLDPLGIEYGILQPLSIGSQTFDQGLGAAVCGAHNEWQLDKWTGPEARLKASLCVPQDDPDAAIAEIERHDGNKQFVQISIPPRANEPLGRKRYWPVYRAAAERNLPISLHSAAYGPGANSGSGWMSYYIEEHYAFAHSLQSVVTSMVMEGVFEEFPKLRVICVEGGFAWVPALGWRLDKAWERNRDELPHVKRPPSEYMREHFWYTTQPMEEPEHPKHLLDTIRWIGADRLMFSTDYPHWDFDDPRQAFKVRLDDELDLAIFRNNAKAVYGLE